MEMIKASTELPPIGKKVILRFPWHDNTVVLDYGILRPKEEQDNQKWFATDNYGSIPEREPNLEWLSETPSTEWVSVEEHQKEIDRVKGLLKIEIFEAVDICYQDRKDEFDIDSIKELSWQQFKTDNNL